MPDKDCPECGGSGYVLSREGRWQVARPCPLCSKQPDRAKGSGRRRGRPRKIPPGHTACIVCGGSRRMERYGNVEACTACGGVGHYPVVHR